MKARPLVSMLMVAAFGPTSCTGRGVQDRRLPAASGAEAGQAMAALDQTLRELRAELADIEKIDVTVP